MTPKEARRFLLERIEVGEGDCWVWQLGKTGNGYGALRHEGLFWPAHRFAYHYCCAYLHKTDVVHHACARKDCVNPDHLQALTPEENGAEMHERQTYRRTIVSLQDEVERLIEQIEHLYDCLEEGSQP